MKNNVFIVGIVLIAIGLILSLMTTFFSGLSFLILGIIITIVGAVFGGEVSYNKVNVFDATNINKLCPNCGRSIPADAKFCPYCTHNF